jgi:hypothetical protein
MWPAILPREIRESSLRAAEVKVYDLLASKLDRGWVVFYSRPWLGLTPSGEEKDGECDFVVMHPAWGYIALEVKGGGIAYDPKTDQWRTIDRNKIRHTIKNPIKQAVASKYELIKQVKTLSSWPGRSIRRRHGVIFPDTVMPPDGLGADCPREIACCREDLATIDQWIKGRLTGGTFDDLGADGIRAFEELLARPFLLRVPLGHYLEDDEQAIAALTPQQYYILDAVGHLNRVAAGGGAGTGKTILAIEDAVRLAQRGLKTCLLCYSELFAAYLNEKLAKVDSDVRVWSLAGLCGALASDAGIEWTPDLGLEKGIEALLTSVKEKPSLKFDAIVVDEAQDFRSHWWVAIEEALVDHESSWLHAFFDTNQSVYGDFSKELASFRIVPIHLTRNLRNTRNIHDTATRFYRGIPIAAGGPEGVPVAWHEVREDQVYNRAVTEAQTLIKENVGSEDIIILVSEDSAVLTVRNRAGFPNGVQVSTVRNFKGLERKAVIVAATREMADQPELAYVSMSRPRAQLTVIGARPMLEWMGKT